MFGLFKKPKTTGEQNEAAIEKLKKLMEQELISRDCLKKLGLKTLLTSDPQITNKISHRDACECLRILKFASFMLLDFAAQINQQASKVNDEILANQGAKGFIIRPKTTSHPFYTIKNIMELFRAAKMAAPQKDLDPQELEDPFSPLPAYLKMYGSALNIATTGITYNITFVGMVIR